MVPLPSTFILFFVRWPEPGRVKTRLAAGVGAEEASRIHAELAERCFANVTAVQNAHVIVCATGAAAGTFRGWLRGASDYWDQPAGGLGHRLERMFDRAFAHGASRVVAIGSDAPELTAQDIEEAIGALDQHEVSILPATDGGYVLIGSCRHFPELFRDMPWSTSGLLSQTLQTCSEFALKVHLGPVRRDVDTLEDLELLQSRQVP